MLGRPALAWIQFAYSLRLVEGRQKIGGYMLGKAGESPRQDLSWTSQTIVGDVFLSSLFWLYF